MGGWPLWAVIPALFVIVLARSHLFYWLGRGALGGAERLADRTPDAVDEAAPTGTRAHVQRLMRTPTARRGLAMVHRFGPFAVTLAYLTVGVQTAVFVGSGLVRMPYLRFTAASLPGAVAWAFIWGTVGLGAVWAAVRLASASPWGLAAVLLLLAGVVTGLTLRRRTRRTRRTPAAAPADQLA
jgi:membrane protein DedA with SNARE-associated domain